MRVFVSTLTAVDSDKVNENWSTTDLEIINQTASTCDAWIRQRSQHLLTYKLEMKTKPLST
jgi:hypothetical protein